MRDVSQRFFACVAGALLSAAIGFASVAGADDSPTARQSAYSAVQATGKEFRISLSRTKIKPGTMRVEFVNFGEDDHDLAVTRKTGGATKNVGTVRPGERGVMTMSAKRGSYVFWCTLSDHKARGMRAVLRVRK